jgi:hypothetical protein
MSPEQQRIKIAEACGWTIHGTKFRIYGNPDDPFSSVSACHDLYGFPRTGGDDWIPDYLNCLNAMHEAEKVLADNEERQYKYISILVGKDWSESWAFTDAGKAIHATAAHRAEAFLRTLGLWKDDASHLSTVDSTTASINKKE